MIDTDALPLRLRRALRAAWWLVPCLFCLWLYWYGLRSWFQQDDFTWLQLEPGIHSWSDFVRAVFSPARNGTFRPLSERFYFVAFRWIFGLEAAPWRMLVFLTQFANLALLASITWKLTGSRLAGFFAPVFWVLNASMVVPMVWTSAYMQILCGFCLLLSFRLFLRYVETGRMRDYLLQWIPFLTGFLVMETTVVYPAIAAAFAILCSRKHFKSTLPLFVPSAVYLFLHAAFVPKNRTGAYSIHLDSSIFVTFGKYWEWVFAPAGLHTGGLPAWIGTAITVVFTIALVAALALAVRKRNYIPLFFAGCFLIVLGPVLPLRDHLTGYYLTLPVLGTSMLCAYAFAAAWRGGLALKGVAVILLALFLWVSVPTVRTQTRWWAARSWRVKTLANGALQARRLHPSETILLTGVDSDLFWSSIYDGVFPAVGVTDILLAPGSDSRIEAHPDMAELDRFILHPMLVQKALRADRLVVYDVSGPRPRAVTANFRANWQETSDKPRRIEFGQSSIDDLLGDGWWAAEQTHRWMRKSAVFQIAGPRTPAEVLHLSGYCPPEQVAAGPLTLTVSVDGKPLEPVRITRGGAIFDANLALPASVMGKPAIEVTLEVSRTMHASGRDVGLAVSLAEIVAR